MRTAVDIAQEVLKQVRTTIVLNMRFMDMAVFRLRLFPENVTLATDGNCLFFNPVWLLKRYQNENNAVTRDYLHVLLHCVFRHPFVHSLIDQPLWNLACDIAVESMICDFGQKHFSVQNEVKRQSVIGQLSAKVHPMTAEKLYHYFQDHKPKSEWFPLFHADDHDIWYDPSKAGHMASQAQQNRQPNYQSDNNLDNDDTPQHPDSDRNSSGKVNNSLDPEAQQASDRNHLEMSTSLEDEWRDISNHIQMDLETFAKEQGYQAGNMEQMLAAVNREKYDYESFLKKFAVMGEVMKINDDEFDYIFYTYGLKLFKNMPLIEPLEYKEVKRIRDFVIAIDTSGSTSGELVQKFLTKTYNILESTERFFAKVNIFIVQCDADIQEAVKITKKEEFDEYIQQMTIKGLGGTDFRPVFTYIDCLIREKAFTNLKGMIYFTDGCGTFPARKPDYQAAFVFVQDVYNNLDVPPWAIKLILEKEEWSQ